MTDVSEVQAHAEPQPASFALYAGPPAPAYSAASPLDGPVEGDESSTIKCICGFADDDGNTVLCERCDTWQHILCYYETEQNVPDVHECTDCAPRIVDSKGASDKQRHRRELFINGERKARPKTAAKNPKKRSKDTPGAVQPNGWPMHPSDAQYTPDRKSGSPRDLPPPNKRPKTSHRTSGSMSMIGQAPALPSGPRKRGGSVMVNGNSPVKSPSNPDASFEDFSSEFMILYRQPEPQSPESNGWNDIGVANDISTWLTDPDALADVTGGKKLSEFCSRIDGSIQDLPAPTITKQEAIDHGILAHGLHPQWHFITVDTVVADGGFVGELKGQVGRKQAYFDHPSNRWDLLRHPEPFVFFPPHLPIYIDTRQEGNILRYARRSCQPNMRMEILVESSNDFHFCFLAKRQIEVGEELTIGWELDYEVYKQLGKVLNNGGKDSFRKIQPWVSCVLANFGGCACDTSMGYQCLLELARRNTVSEPPKTKGRKTKKSQLSPHSTGHATNSRAGSETLNRDAGEDDQMDARSTSGSHKSSSRDITPATHSTLEVDLKMSEREKRKLQQSEKLFQQMDSHEEHKGKKGKRNSAGSALNTPSIITSVRHLTPLSSISTNESLQKRLGHSEASPTVRHREHSHGVARKTSGSSTKTNGRPASCSRPVYAEASTQTDDDNIIAAHQRARPRDMKPPLSFKRKLLQQALEDKLQRERMRSTSVKLERGSPSIGQVLSNKPSPLPPSPPLDEPSTMDTSNGAAVDVGPREPTPAKEPTPTPTVDTEMGDADSIAANPQQTKVEEMTDATTTEDSMDTSHPPIDPPVPPWPLSTSEAGISKKLVDLHVDMPANPHTTNGIAAHTMITPGSASNFLMGSTIAQSPSGGTLGSPFSPAVNNAVNPAPLRKKLSLSDYTSRRAKLAQTHSTGSNSTPPLAYSQSTSSPTLSVASLPNTNSPPRKSVEPLLPSVDEEPNGIDTTVVSTATTTTSI